MQCYEFELMRAVVREWIRASRPASVPEDLRIADALAGAGVEGLEGLLGLDDEQVTLLVAASVEPLALAA